MFANTGASTGMESAIRACRIEYRELGAASFVHYPVISSIQTTIASV